MNIQRKKKEFKAFYTKEIVPHIGVLGGSTTNYVMLSSNDDF
jgi:hypothetical protein